MKDLLCDQFQETVGECLIRHKNVLDTVSKLQESVARVNRAVAKAVTDCGCITVHAEKHPIPEGISLEQLRTFLDSGVRGQLCDNCREVLETEIGQTLFYMTGVLNTVDMNLYDCLLKEQQRISALGIFNFS
ncbi:MAG: DUF1573 domain-containing protein [Thermaerobacter sp.]|nr:DUF1573 domain-containing protein [Thermaerobacter sp.]